MTCREFAENMYVWDMLPEAEQREAETHRQQCPACQALAADVMQSQVWIKKVAENIPAPAHQAALTHRIMKAIWKKRRTSFIESLFQYAKVNSARLAFSALSVVLISVFVYEWKVIETSPLQNRHVQSKITLSTPRLMESWRRRRENRQETFSLYSYYKEARANHEAIQNRSDSLKN
jgi:anti-sigma factor RsiW